jgi:hypothetical protein
MDNSLYFYFILFIIFFNDLSLFQRLVHSTAIGLMTSRTMQHHLLEQTIV